MEDDLIKMNRSHFLRSKFWYEGSHWWGRLLFLSSETCYLESIVHAGWIKKKKIYKIFYLNASFTFFCIVLTRSVLNNDFDDFCLRRLIFFLNGKFINIEISRRIFSNRRSNKKNSKQLLAHGSLLIHFGLSR